MPPSLRSPAAPPSQRSLGHLSPTRAGWFAPSGGSTGCRLSATLTPTASDRPDQSWGASGKPKDIISEGSAPTLAASRAALPPKGAFAAWGGPALLTSTPLCHTRPSRPRPAVCCSATSRVGSHWPLRARRISSVLVESMVGSTSTVKPGSSGDTASQMASAGQRIGDVALTGCGLAAWPSGAPWRPSWPWQKTAWTVAAAPAVPSRAWARAACPGSWGCRTSRGTRP